MGEGGPVSIVVVGGGASGVILAAHLMRRADPDVRVTVIEKGDRIGPGLAYSTTLPDHRLNVLASRMSAFADEPDHFWHWYRETTPDAGRDPETFVPREAYGRYLSWIFDTFADQGGGVARLRALRNECVAIHPNGRGVAVRLNNGISVPAERLVLATGHDPRPDPSHPNAVRIGSDADTPIDPDSRVVILGSGLSMIDTWLALEHRGHRGEIVVVSRRGLLPQSHAARRKPLRLDVADIPLGTELSYFVRWFGELIENSERHGGDWRDVVDGLRPFNQQIWRDWPMSAKRRFLEHTKAWWDIHRHRIPPDIYERAARALERGRLRLFAGKVQDIEERPDGSLLLMIRPRGKGVVEAMDCARIYDCTGIIKDPSRTSNTLIRNLIRDGTARPDPLRIGIDVTEDCAVIDGSGVPSDRIFAVGPLTRGTFFEIDAVPDIRVQCERLAGRLIG